MKPTEIVAVPVHPPGEIARPIPHEEIARLQKLLDDHEFSPNTKRSYQSDIDVFVRWCSKQGHAPVPTDPSVLCVYLTALAEGTVEGKLVDGKRVCTPHKMSTVTRHLAAIRHAHIRSGLQPPGDHPSVKRVMKTLRRKFGTAPTQKTAATSDMIRKMAERVPSKTRTRDRAVLLFGFAGAFRRSELVGLKIEDVVSVDEEGLVVLLRRSKTDQEGKGFYKKIIRGGDSTCPVEALLDLVRELREQGIESGFLFRRDAVKPMTDKSVATLVKRCASAVGLDPKTFAGHSLRAGFVTAAYRAGATLRDIQDITGHKSLSSLEMYIRTQGDWKHHAGKGLL